MMDEKMKVLVVSPSGWVKERFITELLSAGFLAYHISGIHDTIKKIKEIKPDVVILEWIEEFSEEALHIVKSIKQDPEYNRILFIGYINPQDKNTIIQMLQAGFVNFIVKPINQFGIVYKKVIETAEKHRGVPPTRQLVRVSLENENTRIIYRSPNTSRVVIGKVLDLSIGGARISIIGDETLKEEQEIPNAKLQIGEDRYAEITFKVVNIDHLRKQYGIKFTNMSYESLKTIAMYIFEILTFQQQTRSEK